jgi:arsenate reductase-like glutaredoxin family protein
MQSIFNPIEDAKAIRTAITKPKNMANLIQIVAHRSNNQRQQILASYYDTFKTPLTDDLKKELSGNFKDAVIALFSTPVEYDCNQLRKAMKGLGTNEDTIIEILATRSNERIREIIQFYNQILQRDLLKDIESDTSGFFREILRKLLEASRSNNPYPDESESEKCAKEIYNSTEGKNAKKEDLQNTFIYIFTKKSREELASISKIYFTWYSKTLLQVVEEFCSGDSKRVLKAIIYSLLSPSEYFAYRINKAVKGLGTNDTILIRVLVSRDEIDIERIKRYYKQLYKIDLYKAIEKDTSGDYRNLLLELIGK